MKGIDMLIGGYCIVIVFTLGFSFGYDFKKDLERDAIKAGVAEWVPAEDGHAELKWKKVEVKP